MKNRLKLLCGVILLLLIIFKDSIYRYLGIITLPNIDKVSEIYDKNILDKYNSLLSIVNLTEYNDYDYDYTKALYQDIYDYTGKITIYHGKDYNFQKNMAVVNNDGLVGIISAVDDYSSDVTLITNEEISLSVKIGEYYGILKNNLGKYYIEGISNASSVDENDEVLTSGLGNIIGNIPVGKVTNKENGIIEMKPFFNYSRLNYLIVIKDII